MVLRDDKPGVMGVISNIGQAAKQGVVTEVKKTVENSVEQISGKEKEETLPQASASSEAMKAQQEKDNKAMLDALYGPSTPAETPQAKVSEKQGDLKRQMGFGEKPDTTGSLGQQMGLDTKATNQATANPLEQIGMGKSTTTTASAVDQLNFNPAPAKTPGEQQQIAQLKNQLHSDYYQKLTTPQNVPDTEERQKEAQEEHENTADRMARLEREDQIEDQKKKEKQQPLDVANAQNMEKNRGSSG